MEAYVQLLCACMGRQKKDLAGRREHSHIQGQRRFGRCALLSIHFRGSRDSCGDRSSQARVLETDKGQE